MEKSPESLPAQREEFGRHKLVLEILRLANIWQRTYCRMVRALADEFGEEVVLDTVEKVWWDQAYEIGLGWRERFEADPVAAMRDKASSWHDSAVWARICCCDVEQTDDRWELRAVKCYRELFNQMGEPEIGISWCMTDFAAVKGWGANLVMRQPKQLLRGDNYCHQIRYITDDPTEQWSEYSRELSEMVGWRSVRRLEEEEE
jgi:hypothetical protein